MDIARINNMSDKERKNYFSSSLDDNEREDIPRPISTTEKKREEQKEGLKERLKAKPQRPEL